MVSLGIIIALTVFGSVFCAYTAYRLVAQRKEELRLLRLDRNGLSLENERLEQENALLQEGVLGTINLYEVTRDMCISLDQQVIFDHFKAGLRRFIHDGRCVFEKSTVPPPQRDDSVVVPLMIQDRLYGYLSGEQIRQNDREIFTILAQQFLLAMRRAILYEQVQGLIVTDGLTQTLSRRYFLERFQEEMLRSATFALQLSFLMIDIDHFKECNDHYGHLVGDAVLRKVGQILKDKIRQMDFIGRYGGEELSIVLVETDKQHALRAAERIRSALEQTLLKVYDEQLTVTISIGVASYPDDAQDAYGLIEKADAALYQAKEAGRNQVVG